ncbi:RagB/SusD family nutrient uptake outer membrane protein [Geofilum rhodophaeum]|uniref:RagB/SusD family nutrient uptake outer membrane protein n=1 Tax=Geofilum rhodophaeum TaxID=1965019 RepID=UPI000B526090|nr:RagB/SusD family nutrient uptake outer membrane protein [Geofilum rhodophaeum]
MKWLNRVFVLFGVLGLMLSSCEDMLEADYNGVIAEEDYHLNSPNDSIYSMLGIVKALEALGERYVVLGEVRGELLELTPNASEDIRQISNFEPAPDNRYADVRDYYAVINRCNLFVERLDTSIVAQGQKVMQKEFAAAKAIRAWTYLQLLLNHGEAHYYENALVSVLDAEEVESKSRMNLEEVLPLLIADLETVRDIPLPGSLELGEDVVDSRKLLLPVRFVLGDLYLYNGDYEKAAQAYYDLMYNDFLLLTDEYRLQLEVVDLAFTDYFSSSWNQAFRPINNETELVSFIAGSVAYGSSNGLDSLFRLDYELKPSEVALDYWDTQTYYHSQALSRQGDLRRYGSFSVNTFYLGSLANSETRWVNRKYTQTENTWAVPIYRVGLLYLRYAEAVNRAGKPNLAFAVLKNGVSAAELNNNSIIPEQEKIPLAPYMDFTRDRFNVFSATSEINTRGVHSRGSGNVHNIVSYVIASEPDWTLQDSILYVEDLIVTELALETAFEGNRFHDLMRVAKRRNDPAYLASKVASRAGAESLRLQGLLMDEKNWYLPY